MTSPLPDAADTIFNWLSHEIRSGKAQHSVKQIAGNSGVPEELASDLLRDMVELGWIMRWREEGKGAYHYSLPAEEFTPESSPAPYIPEPTQTYAGQMDLKREAYRRIEEHADPNDVKPKPFVNFMERATNSAYAAGIFTRMSDLYRAGRNAEHLKPKPNCPVCGLVFAPRPEDTVCINCQDGHTPAAGWLLTTELPPEHPLMAKAQALLESLVDVPTYPFGKEIEMPEIIVYYCNGPCGRELPEEYVAEIGMRCALCTYLYGEG